MAWSQVPYEAFSGSNSGTLLHQTVWMPKLIRQFPVQSMWAKFINPGIGGVSAFARKGETYTFSMIPELPVGAVLTDNATIPKGTQVVTQVSATLQEFGKGLIFQDLSSRMCDVNFQSEVGESISRNMILTMDKALGSLYVNSGQYFSITGTTSYVENTGSTGTGTFALAYSHLTQIEERMRRIGVQGFPEFGGRYVLVGPPGAFNTLRNSSQFYESAAMLGLNEVFTGCEVGMVANWVVLQENGANASTTYSATSGISVALGADAVCAADNLLTGANVFRYDDPDHDAGRVGWVVWRALMAGARICDGTNTARSYLVYSAHK